MGKYDPLKRFLERQDAEIIPLSFAEIERLIDAKLPESKRYPAWWSNNPWNNVMTKAWLEAGFVTEQVDTAAERLVFRRKLPAGAQGLRPQLAPRGRRFMAFGAMKGTVRMADDFDPTAPADPDWGDERE